MPRLTLFIALLTLVGLLLLDTRQTRLRLKHQANALHAQVLSAQSVLWQNQLEIAAYTAPQVVKQMAESKD